MSGPRQSYREPRLPKRDGDVLARCMSDWLQNSLRQVRRRCRTLQTDARWRMNAGPGKSSPVEYTSCVAAVVRSMRHFDFPAYPPPMTPTCQARVTTGALPLSHRGAPIASDRLAAVESTAKITRSRQVCAC